MILNRINRSYTTENSKWLKEKQIDIKTNFNNPSHIRRCKIEKPTTNTTIHRLSKVFDSINRNKMKFILRKYGIPTEIINAIMMLYRNTRSMVRSPDGDTTFFGITTGFLQGDTLAPFLFIVCLDYILKTSIYISTELGFTLTQRRSRRYPDLHITYIDYTIYMLL